jgi:hypothetical protein
MTQTRETGGSGFGLSEMKEDFQTEINKLMTSNVDAMFRGTVAFLYWNGGGKTEARLYRGRCSPSRAAFLPGDQPGSSA